MTRQDLKRSTLIVWAMFALLSWAAIGIAVMLIVSGLGLMLRSN